MILSRELGGIRNMFQILDLPSSLTGNFLIYLFLQKHGGICKNMVQYAQVRCYLKKNMVLFAKKHGAI